MDDKNNAIQCECVHINYAKRILETSGINQDDFKKTFGNFKTVDVENINSAKNDAMQYVMQFKATEKDRKNSIVFLGKMDGERKKGVGTGKTHLALAITNNLMDKAVAVRYFSYREEIVKIKQCVNDSETYQRTLNAWKTCRVLFIDDLFKGTPTEADIKAVYEIINYRYLNRLPVIVTTELNIMAMDNIDQAIASRVYEMSRYVCTMGGDGANYRYR